MNWSERTVSNTLTVERYTVNDIMVSYLCDEFYVNRRYQRKLVWEIEEKRLLIDSMLKGIPLPAILLVKFTVPAEDKNMPVLEIVDGMQRLNAITSFVLGEYSIMYQGKMCFFDPNSYNETFQLLRDGKIKEHESLLPKEVCMDFIRYQLPAIITGKDDEVVEMIFSRINSTGRKISSQDLRQSVATGEFPDLVRRISSRVRGDYTYDDRVCLSDMPKISVGYKKYGYGVDLDSIFWRRHDLINAKNIKESKDEELIESLLATVLLKESFRKSRGVLDELYKKDSHMGKQIENEVSKNGKIELENRFAKIFDIIDMIFESVNSNFSSFLFTPARISNKDECFKILFLALYKLYSEGYSAEKYTVVADSLKKSKDLFSKFTKTGKVNYDDVNNAVNNLYYILKPHFNKAIKRVDNEMVEEITRRLSYSRIERQMTEFKIGMSYFDRNELNIDCIHKVAKTLVGMSNVSNPTESGLVIIGVADSKESYDSWFDKYNKSAVIVDQHYIPGISAEAEKLFKNTDLYMNKIRKKIEKEPISPKLKDYILETFNVISYYDVELLIFRSKNMGEISLYDGDKYVRHSSSTVKM